MSKKEYTKAERKAWGEKMAEARAAKAKSKAKSETNKAIRRLEYGTGKISSYRPVYSFVPKGKAPKSEGFNDKLMRLGNGIASNMIGSIPGLSSIMGSGDYKVGKNTLLVDGVPQFSSKAGGRYTRVRHREYIADITTSATPGSFKIDKFAINPALASTLPWFAALASNYEEYKIKGMIFEFKSMSADALNSTNTALGSVIMATQYNVLSNDFTSKQQMENYEFAGSTKPSCSLIHPIECEPKETVLPELFTRSQGTTITGADLRLYDFGNFYIATTGMQGTSVNIGELWCSYDIVLYKPKIGVPSIQADHYILNTGVAVNNYFGTPLPAATSSSNMGTTITNNTITIPKNFTGTVFISWIITGTATALSTITVTYSGGATAQNGFTGATVPVIYGSGLSVLNEYIMNITVKCVQGGMITFANGTLPTSPTSGDLYIIGTTLTN